MTNECPECRAGLEHCHGTVIVHARLGSECTEPDCARPDIAHAFRLDCDAVGCRCDAVSAVSAVAV
jgi:hypothetical protein